MPAPRFKSRTLRRVNKKLPSGKVTIHYVKRKHQLPKCAICKKELKGMPKTRPFKLQKSGISKKRPERPFGGFLCSKCSREEIKKQSRV
jgi:large subunit ribosomal protein L34e